MTDEYDGMTADDEFRILQDILEDTSTGEFLGIPGIYEIVREFYNNDLLTRWKTEREGETT